MRTTQRWLVLLVALTLMGCEIQGGVARTTSVPGALPPTPAASVVADASPAASAAASAMAVVTPTTVLTAVTGLEASGLRIGLLNDPGDLLPYYEDSVDERSTAPISQLLFPAPLLALGYTYTTTGVLERVPSIENGDVLVTLVPVYLDQTGSITTTATATLTQVEQISVTFHWNPNLVWSDGVPVTANDSVFAYELAQQTSLGQETLSKLDLLERYEQVDAHTTRAVLKPDFIDPVYLTTYFTPLPRHLLANRKPAELRTGAFALLPVGYGPYMVERRDQGSLRLTRNPHYQGPTGPLATVSFVFHNDPNLLHSLVAGGSLDVVALDQPTPETLAAIKASAATGAVRVNVVPSPIWEHLDFNLDVAVLQDLNVRRAIAQAINREALVATLLGGYGAVLNSWIVAGQWAAAPTDQLTPYPYSPTDARHLLDAANLIDTNRDGLREVGGQPLTLSLVTTQGSALRLAAAQRIRDDLLAVGVGLSLQEVPTAGLYSPTGPLFRRTFQLALFAWIAGPDPRGWERWSCAGVPSASNGWTGNNFPGWCFYEADKAIRVATTSLNHAERTAAYLRQQQLFAQELPVLPLFQRIDLVLANPTLVGVSADPTAPFTWNLAGWSRQ